VSFETTVSPRGVGDKPDLSRIANSTAADTNRDPESMLVGTAPFIYLARILPGKTKTYVAVN
jgi:hypothetical protein